MCHFYRIIYNSGINKSILLSEEQFFKLFETFTGCIGFRFNLNRK